MQPIGGYFSIEINEGRELHYDALRLNAGRYALEYIIKARKYSKVYIPYYICDSILQPFERLGVAYEFYHINEQLEPANELHPQNNEAVLFVNYFGLKNRIIKTYCNSYMNTILDHTQAFYSERGNKFKSSRCNCDTFYSCRKYFGVPDGAYLYTDCFLDEKLPQDESFGRMTFLMKRIDRSPQEAYDDFQTNDKDISTIGLKRMSKLTEAMMSGIDYTTKGNRRIQNFYILDNILRETNLFKWDLDYGSVPLVYPYYIEEGARLRQILIDHQVFCARYWPNVQEWCQPEDWEYHLAENLVCLPIDQRYGKEDMKRIVSLLNDYITNLI